MFKNLQKSTNKIIRKGVFKEYDGSVNQSLQTYLISHVTVLIKAKNTKPNNAWN